MSYALLFLSFPGLTGEPSVFVLDSRFRENDTIGHYYAVLNSRMLTKYFFRVTLNEVKGLMHLKIQDSSLRLSADRQAQNDSYGDLRTFSATC